MTMLVTVAMAALAMPWAVLFLRVVLSHYESRARCLGIPKTQQVIDSREGPRVRTAVGPGLVLSGRETFARAEGCDAPLTRGPSPEGGPSVVRLSDAFFKGSWKITILSN